MIEADFYDQDALLDRLTDGARRSGKEIVFLVGSALTAPITDGERGVPGVPGVIELIRAEFDNCEQKNQFDRAVASASNQYQEAFRFLLGRRGPQAANGIIKAAMAKARRETASEGKKNNYALSSTTDEPTCRAFDQDKSGWVLSRTVKALGELITRYPSRFGRTVLTTNFDPLVEVAISTAGGIQFRTVLHRDGNLGQSEGDGTHVIHLHGYWYGSDTLHTPRQLGQPRPLLKASLAHLIRNKIVVVIGYGGWDDAFADALAQVVADDSAFPEVIWTLYKETTELPEPLSIRLEPGLSRGRVTLYNGIDCHLFLPKLRDWWERNETPERTSTVINISDTLYFPDKFAERSAQQLLPKFVGEENPPNTDFYVGREDDLRTIESGLFSFAFITGMGGQGKSSLAATYFNAQRNNRSFDYFLWRDCKEQSERFEDQLVKIIESLSGGASAASELAKRPIIDLATLFVGLTKNIRMLIIFDNVDHYIDLEKKALIGAPGVFMETTLNKKTNSRFVFTCRPSVEYENGEILIHRLGGLEQGDAVSLFNLRSAVADKLDVIEAHRLTSGHALWLNLLAAQVGKGRARLPDLLVSLKDGTAHLPEPTLRSIWATLPDREKIVLQTLAETLRPTSEFQLSNILDTRLRYNQMMRALRSLRESNLVVVRLLENSEEGIELHPLIRAFIRTTFPIADRISFIRAVLTVYGLFRISSGHRRRPSPTAETASQWVEGAELSANAEDYQNALDLLDSVTKFIKHNCPPGDFIRIFSAMIEKKRISGLFSYKSFENVFDAYIIALTNIGRGDQADLALNEYEASLSGKDARYIHFCAMKCNSYWTRQQFALAVDWGERGERLKESSGVDTAFSSAHSLALAKRDIGQIDDALAFFSKNVQIDDIIDASKFDDQIDGSVYGNIGRCFQLMGQVDTALTCFRKSAFSIENDTDYTNIENQAFIRQWIGELLLIRDERRAACLFLLAAKNKWSLIAPPRADRVAQFIDSSIKSEGVQFSPAVERFCVDWIRSFHVERAVAS